VLKGVYLCRDAREARAELIEGLCDGKSLFNRHGLVLHWSRQTNFNSDVEFPHGQVVVCSLIHPIVGSNNDRFTILRRLAAEAQTCRCDFRVFDISD
jgi:hypothetical protein